MASPPAPEPLPPSTDQPILFRPSKKRKLYRQRDASPPAPEAAAVQAPAPDSTTAVATSPAPAQSLDELIASGAAANEQADEAPSLAEILRLRKQRRARAAAAVGIEGRHGHGEADDEEDGHGSGLVERSVESGSHGVVRRFAPQTGVAGRDEVDRHMMAYIDSELAKRRQQQEGRSQPPPDTVATSTSSISPSAASPSRTHADDRGKLSDIHREPAALGKLLEIDLGDEARDRNVLRTEQARRRMGGEVLEDEEDGAAASKGKVRLGRDGKPWRGKKRRGSEDIKRDKLVEEFLRENRLDNIYDEGPAAATTTTTVSDGQAADDVLAEAFRKEFMDAVSQRQRKKATPAQPAPRGPGGKREEELKGPKLGGSRSARAAMRETLLKNAKK